MNPSRLTRLLPLASSAALLSVLLAGCVTAPPPAGPSAPAAATAPAPMQPPLGLASAAQTTDDYRIDAAYHLYDENRNRIYHGVLPHFLYAIGVLQIQVDSRGNVKGLNWLRAPEHAPEVVAEIERTVRAAAPFPAPVRMGGATYLDTWLWDASGRFQLHTLSEGQGDPRTAHRAIPPDPRGIRVSAAPAEH